MVTKTKEKRYPQLQSVRLGPDFAWILDALERQPEGKAEATRAMLSAVVGKKGTKDLEIVDHSGQVDPAHVLPPTRLVHGYEHLPEAIEATAAKVARKAKRPVDRADVIRSALWVQLAKRGVKHPKKPADLYALVRKHAGLMHSELAEKLGLSSWKIVARMRREMEIPPLPEQEAIARRLTKREVALALNDEMSQTHAAKLIGVSQKTVSLVRKKAREKK